MSPIKTVGISIRPQAARAKTLANELATSLVAHGCDVLCDATQASKVHETASLQSMAKRVDLLIVLGGDGTLLHAARHFMNSNVPILGINLGRLGFLTDTPVGSMFDVVESVLAGHYKTKHHFGLHASCWRDGQCLKEDIAMNDVVLQRYAHPRPIEFEVIYGDQSMFRLHADGVVLATPAGSTAYALSAGGPIVHPEVEAISVVPLCPHTLSNRPVLIPANEIITLQLLSSPNPSVLNLDGQESFILSEGDAVKVKKAGEVSLIYLPERHYFNTLRSKLHWAGHEH
ncbi:MAG: NAD(+)/NADH kinase [Mariprofundaceae bacterium]|nr:NAD(+)/NADH kinase [Mariprofundaceae bacterium]